MCPCKQVLAFGLKWSNFKDLQLQEALLKSLPPESLENSNTSALRVPLLFCSLAIPSSASTCYILLWPLPSNHLAIFWCFFQVSNIGKRAFPPFSRRYSELFHLKNLIYLNLNAQNYYFKCGCYYIDLMHALILCCSLSSKYKKKANLILGNCTSTWFIRHFEQSKRASEIVWCIRKELNHFS